MTLQRRLFWAGSSFVLVVLAGGAVCVWALGHWDNAAHRREGLLRASMAVEQLTAAYSDQESGEFGFKATGEESALEPYTEGVVEEARLVDDLETLLADEPAARRRLESVGSAAERWRAEVVEPQIEMRRLEGRSSAAVATEASDGGAAYEDVRARVDDLAGLLASRVDVVDRDTARSRRVVLWALGATVALTAALSALLAVLTRRWVTRPLRLLAIRVVEPSDGLIAVQASGAPELHAVAAAIDQMRRDVVAQRDEAVRAREALEQSATLAVHVQAAQARQMGGFPGDWSVAGALRPAEGLVAGDAFAVALTGPRSIGLVVLDIAGHGAAPAINALRCRELLKAALRSGQGPAAALEWLYQQDHGLDDSFMSAVVAVIDTTTGACRYANAGHPPPLVVGLDGVCREWRGTGPVLGLVPPGWYESPDHLAVGEVLFVYTDGLTEARSDQHTFYGEQRVEATLRDFIGSANGAVDADDVLEHVLADLDDFQAERLADDVTVVVVRRLASLASASSTVT